MTHYVAGFHQSLWHEFRVNAERFEHRCGPGSRLDVVDAANVSGGAVIDAQRAGEVVLHIAVGRKQISRFGPDLRFMAFEPEDLGVTVIAVDAIPAYLL
ncbi:hypothetical protein D3C77_486230 [compost metagenome]